MHKQSFSETNSLQVRHFLGKIQSKSFENIMNIIFNKNLFCSKFMQIDKKCNIKDLYLHEFSEQIVLDKLSVLSKKFSNALIYGLFFGQDRLKNVQNIYNANIAETKFYKQDYQFDEEHNPLQNKFDLIITNLTMQYNNDVVGALKKYYSILNKDGLFICNLIGGSTMHELKQAMLKTDLQCFKKVYPRVIPMIEIKKMGSLMQNIGFDIPFCSSEKLVAEYSTLSDMLKEIKAMAFGNYMIDRVYPYNAKYFQLLEENYIEEFSENSKLPITFEVITAFGSKNK